MNIVFLRHGDAEASFLFYFELPLLTTRANNAARRSNRSGHAFRTRVYRKRFLRIQFLREAISQTHQNMAGPRTGENMGVGGWSIVLVIPATIEEEEEEEDDDDGGDGDDDDDDDERISAEHDRWASSCDLTVQRDGRVE